MFFSRQTFPITKAVPSGSRLQKQYQRSTNLRGKPILEEVAEIDLQDRINSFAQECDINRIIQRAANGDPDVLHKVQGSYIDISGMPDNVHDLHKLIQRSEEVFNNLSDDVKAGRSFEEFLRNIDNYQKLVTFANSNIEEAHAHGAAHAAHGSAKNVAGKETVDA